MSRAFVQALTREIEELESSLAQDARYRKLSALRQVLAHYDELSHAKAEPSASSELQPPRQNFQPPLRRASSLAREKAVELAEEYLRGRREPTPTREIYAFMLSRGAELRGKEPTSNLSAILSKSAEFVPHGRAGWTLSEPSTQIADQVDPGLANDGNGTAGELIDDGERTSEQDAEDLI